MNVTATVTHGPIGADDLEIDIMLTGGASIPPQDITFPAGTVEFVDDATTSTSKMEVTFSDLDSGRYTLEATSAEARISIAEPDITIVGVTLTRTPADTVTINDDFSVIATITDPADYSGTAMLILSGIAGDRTLTLTGLLRNKWTSGCWQSATIPCRLRATA